MKHSYKLCRVKPGTILTVFTSLIVTATAFFSPVYAAPGDEPLVKAAQFVFDIMTGEFAIIVAGIAGATIGFMMYSGRIELRRVLFYVGGTLIIFTILYLVSAFILAIT